MSLIDYLIVATILISVLIGFIRGLVREALSLATWIVALWVAWRFGWVAQPLFARFTELEPVRVWGARALVFAGVLVAGGLLNWALGILIRGTGLTGTDRLLGMLFGLARGAVLFGILVIVGELAGVNQSTWWQQSQLVPYGEQIAAVLRELAGEAGQRLDELNPAPAPDADAGGG